MPERTVSVSLIAKTQNFIANMELASKSTVKLGESAAAAAQRQKEAAATAGTAFLAIGAVAAIGVGLAIKAFADFDAKMSQVQTLSHASVAQMKELSDAALNAGQAIGFSAGDVADAETELVKAGISVTDIMGGALTGALTLAAAGQIDVGQATEIATIAMTQFGLVGQDIPHVADLLAAGADKALGGVADLGEALKSGGLVAAQFGISLDDTIGTLSAFANAGLIGETAGTDLRQMLLKLAAPSKEASATLKQYGIEVYNATGQFVGLDTLGGELQSTLKGVGEEQRNTALATIFGSKAIAGANVLYKEGADGIDEWNAAVNDQGFAAQQAAGKMNNLNGDLKKLQAAFETGLIDTGSSANDNLRSLVQSITGLIHGIDQIPAPMLGVGLAAGALLAATALLGGGFLTIVPKIAATRVALAELKISGSSAAASLGKAGPLLLALTVLTAGFSNLSASTQLSTGDLVKVDAVLKKLNGGSLNKLFKNASNSIVDSTAKTQKFKEALNDSFSGNLFENESSAYKFIDGLSFGLTHLSDTYKTNEAQFKELGTQLSATADTDFATASSQFAVMAKQAGGSKDAFQQLFNAMPDYKSKLIQLASAQGINLTTTQLNNLAIGKGTLAQKLGAQSAEKMTIDTKNLGAAATDTSGQIKDLADAIAGFGKTQYDTDDAAIAFQAAIDGLTDSVKHNGDSLDITTEKGRSNKTALDEIGKSAIASAAAIVTQTGSQKDATNAVEQGRTALVKALAQFHITGKAAQDYADRLGLIPSDVITEVSLTGLSNASAQLAAFHTRLLRDLSLPGRNAPKLPKGVSGNGVLLPGGFADGGILPGRPSNTDNLLVPMAAGEGVATARAMLSASNRMALGFMNAGGDASRFAQTSSLSGGAPIINVDVSVQAGVVATPTQTAKTIMDTIKEGLRNGLPSDWNKAN